MEALIQALTEGLPQAAEVAEPIIRNLIEMVLYGLTYVPMPTGEIQKEVEKKTKKEVSKKTITQVLNRLQELGLIQGKKVGSGKGTWIWWSKLVSQDANKSIERILKKTSK